MTSTGKLFEGLRGRYAPSDYSSLKSKIGKLEEQILGNFHSTNNLLKLEQAVKRKESSTESYKKIDTNRSYRKIKNKYRHAGPFILSELSQHHVFTTKSGRLVCNIEKNATKNYEKRIKALEISKSTEMLRRPKRVTIDLKRLCPKIRTEENKTARKLTTRCKLLCEDKN